MVRKFGNIRQASIAAVEYIIDTAESAIKGKGFCSIVLAGGTTPQMAYGLLGLPVNAKQLHLQQSHFFWGDERWVAPDHPDSNFAMAHSTFFSKVDMPPGNIHRIPTELSNPETAAEVYEKHLRDFFRLRSLTETGETKETPSLPSFDLVLLGMGTDGHTASLFPGSDILTEKKRWVAAVPAGIGSPPVARITLTLPVLNQAKNILFLISGSKKRAILETILARPTEAERLYPAARIKPAGALAWLVAEND